MDKHHNRDVIRKSTKWDKLYIDCKHEYLAMFNWLKQNYLFQEGCVNMEAF